MRRLALPFVLVPGLLSLAGCHQGYSPNTYASTAAQQEAAVQRGVIIGVRQVIINASGAVGAATGGAIGGLAGSQIPGSSVTTALGAIGGTLVGGIGGTVAAQAVTDTKGWEYIVQETGNKLVSVTQTSKVPLPVGQHVLVIADSQQARIVPDYTVQDAAVAPAAKPTVTGTGASATEVNLSPLAPTDNTAAPLQVAPIAVASDPSIPAAPSAVDAPPAATPTATPPASSATSGAAAAPAAVNNATPAPATPSAASTPASVQATPEPPAATPQASTAAPATP